MVNTRLIWSVLKETYTEWRNDKVPRLAAALSYYAAIAMAPLLIIILTLVSFIISREQVQAQVMAQVHTYMGTQGAAVVETILTNADQPDVARLAGLLSLLTLLWSASNIFTQLQDALDTIWGVELREDISLLRKLQHRLLPLLMVLGIGLVLLIVLAASSVLSVVNNFAADLLPGWNFIWQIANFLVSLAIITLSFGLLFKILPDVKIAWRDVWLGAGITALLFIVGQQLLGWYLGSQSGSSVYGAAGSLVVLLLWLYYAAQIFFFGAEFTQVYATRYGQGVRPAKDAVARGQAEPVKAAARAVTSGTAQQRTQGYQAQVQQPPAIALDEWSLSALMSGLVDDGRMLFRKEIELAKHEIEATLVKVARGAALTTGGGLMLYAGALFLLFAVPLLLHSIMPLWFAIFLVGLLVFVEAWIMILWARRKFREFRLVPKQTIERLREDVEAAQEHITA